jgi:hypothetical protein
VDGLHVDSLINNTHFSKKKDGGARAFRSTDSTRI